MVFDSFEVLLIGFGSYLTEITYTRGGQPAAREPHAALCLVSCGSFSHALFLLSAASFSNHVVFAMATHKLHYHTIITLLDNYDDALTSGGDHLFVFTACLSSYREKAIKALKRARLGVAGHLLTTPRWGNPTKCFSHRRNN